MSRKFTINDIAEELTYANEVAECFGYRLSSDGQHIEVEQYDDQGDIVTTYTVTIAIKEN